MSRLNRYKRKLEKKGLVVRRGKGHHVVLDQEGKKILGVFPNRFQEGPKSRSHQNLRATIRRRTGIDIDA